MKQVLFGAIFFSILFGIMAFNIYIIPTIVFTFLAVVVCWMVGSIIDDIYNNYKKKRLK